MNPPSSTLYIPIASPPTPAPSPGPSSTEHPTILPWYITLDPARLSRQEFASLAPLNPSLRREYLASLLNDCTPSELLFISTTITPLLKRDFLRELPPELAIHILGYIDDPRTLARAIQVSKHWRMLLSDEWLWRRMCGVFQFQAEEAARVHRDTEAVTHAHNDTGAEDDDVHEPLDTVSPVYPKSPWLIAVNKRQIRKKPWTMGMASKQASLSMNQEQPIHTGFSYREYFKSSYITMMNWRTGGHIMRDYHTPITSLDNGVVTSVALDAEWIVVGLANCKIEVYSAKTGVHNHTLVGHENGVWAVNLVSRGGYWGGEKGEATCGLAGRSYERHEKGTAVVEAGLDKLSLREDVGTRGVDHAVPTQLRAALGLVVDRRPSVGNGSDIGKKSDVCCSSEGWGQPNALIVSGGCDRYLRVWDVESGHCIHHLPGHTSAIRCIKVLHNRPVAVTGSRDATLRVWDIQRGLQLRVLRGHQLSVRCLDVCGNRAVSGSYDSTCRLWNVDTGECIYILRGHFHEIYSVAFDGVHIASGGLDTTVRVWDAATGECIALLQGHTALVCQLQLSPTILTTGGSDGRVITFCLSTFNVLHRIAAHDSLVTSLQFDTRFLVTGGNDGRVRLFETATGNFVRDLSERSDSVWKVVYRGDSCVVLCKRATRTVMEIWSFRARPDREVMSEQ